MILGSGIDFEEVSRIRAAVQRHGVRFLERIFTGREIAYVERHANRFERYTARFAAKEAGMKALGTGWAQGVHWRLLEVVNGPDGRPALELHGRALEIANAQGCRAIHISLSHTRRQAVAHVILEG